jgi:hypothetical protein
MYAEVQVGCAIEIRDRERPIVKCILGLVHIKIDWKVWTDWDR